jgi:hypothetical protein
MMYKPAQINFSQMGQQIGQNIGQGMQGGQDAMRQRMMQQYLGPQSEAGWQMGTRTFPGRSVVPGMPNQSRGADMWQQLVSRFGRGDR